MYSTDRIQLVAKQIADEFNPDKIILFGSYAYGTPTPDSDVDIMVIFPFEGKNFHASLGILKKISPDFPLDLLARRPDDTKRRYLEGDPLIREVIDHGKILYERNH